MKCSPIHVALATALLGLTAVGAAVRGATILTPRHLFVDVANASLKDSRFPTSSGHALKVETPHDPLVLVEQGTTPALRFNTQLYPGKAKARSEVRIRGADVHFQDSSHDPYYYSQFDLFVPNQAPSDAFERERTRRGDWNIVWQCAQLGAAPPHYHSVTSPPLALQLYERRLYVRTISDYARYTRDTRDDEVYRTWRRARSEAAQGTEVGEGAHIYRELPRYAGYMNRGEWNRVFVKFRLGEQGCYRVWVNGTLEAEYYGPIGYRTADDYADPDPVVNLPGEGRRIRKRASVRFGIYQGYGDPSRGDNPATRTEVLFRRFAIGTDWNDVRFGER